MNNLKKGRTLGRKPSHKKALMKNLATAFFTHGRIETTTAKAKELRPMVEKMITKARVDSVINRRLIAEIISDKELVRKIFSEIAPKYAERAGGYTRILKKEIRPSDSASISIIELV